MKVMQILLLLAAIPTIVHAQQQPAANRSDIHKPICKDPANEKYLLACCSCCSFSLIACCIYSAFLASNESRAKTQIETLQTTPVGQLVISELQRGAYQRGLNDGQRMCPKHSPDAMLRDDAYQPCVCLDWSVKRVKKDQ